MILIAASLLAGGSVTLFIFATNIIRGVLAAWGEA